MGAQWLDVDHLLGLFGHPLFFNFRDHPNLLNCDKHNAKTILLPLQAFHFGIVNQLKFMFIQDVLQDPIFSHLIRFHFQKWEFGTAFKIQLAPIGDQNHTICIQLLHKSYVPLLQGA